GRTLVHGGRRRPGHRTTARDVRRARAGDRRRGRDVGRAQAPVRPPAQRTDEPRGVPGCRRGRRREAQGRFARVRGRQGRPCGALKFDEVVVYGLNGLPLADVLDLVLGSLGLTFHVEEDGTVAVEAAPRPDENGDGPPVDSVEPLTDAQAQTWSL